MLTRPEIGEGIEKTCLRIHLPEQFRDTDTRHHSIDRAHRSRIALDCYKNLVQKTSMKVGYARVSPEEQKLDLLIKNLTVAVCDRLNTVQAQSRATATESRSRFSEAMELLCAGDLLVVWKLDGVKRSIADLINLLKLFGDQGVDLRSSIDEIATTAAGGRGFHIMGAKGLIQERFTAVLASAKKKLQAVGPSAGADTSTNPARECRHVVKARDRIGYGKNTRGELRTIQRTIGIIW